MDFARCNLGCRGISDAGVLSFSFLSIPHMSDRLLPSTLYMILRYLLWFVPFCCHLLLISFSTVQSVKLQFFPLFSVISIHLLSVQMYMCRNDNLGVLLGSLHSPQSPAIIFCVTILYPAWQGLL